MILYYTGGEAIRKRRKKSKSRGTVDTGHKRIEPRKVFDVFLFQVRTNIDFIKIFYCSYVSAAICILYFKRIFDITRHAN